MIQDIRLILMQIVNSNENLGSVELYAFGSATRSNTSPNDIDILAIYNHTEQPRLIRRLLENLLYIRIDLIFMTREEENETDFIRSQNCIPIFQQ